MIELSHLTKRYGEHLAVSDLSFTVDSDQIYGFLGPNGDIAFLHRKDTQIMIYGKCVEVAEVESRLYQCRNVQQAVVRALPSPPRAASPSPSISFHPRQGQQEPPLQCSCKGGPVLLAAGGMYRR